MAMPETIIRSSYPTWRQLVLSRVPGELGDHLGLVGDDPAPWMPCMRLADVNVERTRRRAAAPRGSIYRHFAHDSIEALAADRCR